MSKFILAIFAILALANSCTSGFRTVPQILFDDITGIYRTVGEAGVLGDITIEIQLAENARTVYEARLTNSGGVAEGLGTLADDHLILNFDRGTTDDYYFEGLVVTSGTVVTGIQGSFIFPDHTGTIPATFTIAGQDG